LTKQASRFDQSVCKACRISWQGIVDPGVIALAGQASRAWRVKASRLDWPSVEACRIRRYQQAWRQGSTIQAPGLGRSRVETIASRLGRPAGSRFNPWQAMCSPDRFLSLLSGMPRLDACPPPPHPHTLHSFSSDFGRGKGKVRILAPEGRTMPLHHCASQPASQPAAASQPRRFPRRGLSGNVVG